MRNNKAKCFKKAHEPEPD